MKGITEYWRQWAPHKRDVNKLGKIINKNYVEEIPKR